MKPSPVKKKIAAKGRSSCPKDQRFGPSNGFGGMNLYSRGRELKIGPVLRGLEKYPPRPSQKFQVRCTSFYRFSGNFRHHTINSVPKLQYEVAASKTLMTHSILLIDP